MTTTRRGPARRPLAERLWERVDKNGPNGCWLWTGAVDKEGYGRICVGGHEGPRLLVHRAAYMVSVGPIPDGLEIDHLCRVRACCNPAHLEPVSGRENTARRPVKTHCPRDHAYTPENTYTGADGKRQCRACRAAAARERRKAKP